MEGRDRAGGSCGTGLVKAWSKDAGALLGPVGKETPDASEAAWIAPSGTPPNPTPTAPPHTQTSTAMINTPARIVAAPVHPL
jgi:hypothetical protein